METEGKARGEVDNIKRRGREHSDPRAFPHVGVLSRHGERLGEVFSNGVPASTDASHPSYSADTPYAEDATAAVVSDRGSVESHGGIAAQSAQGLGHFP